MLRNNHLQQYPLLHKQQSLLPPHLQLLPLRLRQLLHGLQLLLLPLQLLPLQLLPLQLLPLKLLPLQLLTLQLLLL